MTDETKIEDDKYSYCAFENRVWRRIFAGLAMQGLIAGRQNFAEFDGEKKPESLEEWAYLIADAMISEGNKD